MAYIYELVVVEGPLLGRRFRIEPRQTLKIGRTCRDIPLFMDERASLEHAEITWTRRDGFWVRDLDSKTGTFVDGRPVPDNGARLGVDAALRVGQTVMRLDERRGIPPWLGWSLAVALPLAVILITLIGLAVRGVAYEPRVVFANPIAQGPVSSEIASVPPSFLRQFGVDHRDLTIRRITDHDADGRSELWIPLASKEVVVEIDAGTGWAVLGELPLGCSDRPGVVFPDQLCHGIRYRWIDASSGPRLVPVQLTSPVAWIPTLVATSTEDDIVRYTSGPARPFLVSVAHPGELAGFLMERGVFEPVHYLVCEGALPGVAAQVLTASGRIQTLTRGCLGRINTSGPGLSETVSDEDPVAVAFTANGYEALVRDARAYVLGDPQDALPGLPRSDQLQAFLARPEGRAVRVTFDGESRETKPIAEESHLTGTRQLLAATGQSAPLLTVASIDSPGLATFDPPGCAVLELETGPLHCLLRRWCTPASTFVSVREVGCGAPRDVTALSYRGGLTSAVVDDIEVWLSADVYGTAGQIDVTRLRVGFRRVPVPDAGGDADVLGLP